MTKPDEASIIKIFQQSFGKKSKFVPEDVEIIQIGKVNFVTKSDMLVQSTDVPPGMKLKEIARKSMVSCVSDFAAKGVKPLYSTISLAIPKGFSKSKILELAAGFKRTSKEFDFKIIGGDTNEGKEIVIEVSMFGTAQKIVNRKGAKIGDLIVTSGPFGYTASGLKILLSRCKAKPNFTRESKRRVFVPKPRLRFGLAVSRYLSSSMDSSDGLSTTLNAMSKQSSKKFVITKLPTHPDVKEFAITNRIKFLDLVFNGGEEYEIVATISPKNLPMVRKIASIQKIPLFLIGYVTKGRNVVYHQENKITTIKDRGWLHFKY